MMKFLKLSALAGIVGVTVANDEVLPHKALVKMLEGGRSEQLAGALASVEVGKTVDQWGTNEGQMRRIAASKEGFDWEDPFGSLAEMTGREWIAEIPGAVSQKAAKLGIELPI